MKIQRRLAALASGAQTRIARRELVQIVELTAEIKDLLAEFDTLTAEHSPALRAETGCGPVTAAILVGQTAGAERFATDALHAPSGRRADPRKLRQYQRHRRGNSDG